MCRYQHWLVVGLIWVSLIGQVSVTGASDPLKGPQTYPPPQPPSWAWTFRTRAEWVERVLPHVMAETDIIVYAEVDTMLFDTLPKTAGDPPWPIRIWTVHWGPERVKYADLGYYGVFFRVDEWIKGGPPVGNTEERYPLLVLVLPVGRSTLGSWMGNVRYNRHAVLFLRQPEQHEDVLPETFHAFRLAGNDLGDVLGGGVWFGKDGRSWSPPDMLYAEFVAYLRQYLASTSVGHPSWGWLKWFAQTERRK